MKWVFKRYLLKACLIIVAFYVALNLYQASKPQPIKIISPNEHIVDNKYIISEKAVMSKLQMKSQIVSLQQDLHKKDTYVDENFFGERQTELKINGTYQMGLNTEDIKVTHIQDGIVYIKLPKPVLINLDIPYDQIKFDKTQGFFRLAMSDDEQQKFYTATKKNIQQELMKNKELLKQADAMNKQVVMELLQGLQIKSVVFE